MGDKWIDQRGFLKGYVKPRQEVVQDQPKDTQSPRHGVPYRPIRCPACRSRNHKCYASKIPVRYHICRDCGFNFKSTEVDG